MHYRTFAVASLLLTAGSSTTLAQVFGTGLNFTAADRADQIVLNGGTYTRSPAPDVNGAVGNDHVVLFIKGIFRAFNKSNGTLAYESSDVSFWNRAFQNNGLSITTTQGAGPSDPRLLYDATNARWIALGIDLPNTANGFLNIAVTSGSDPSDPNAWRGFRVPVETAGQGWPDFPTIGLDRDAFYCGTPIFSAAGSNVGQQFVSIPTSSLYAANPSNLGTRYAQTPSSFNFIRNPVVSLDNTPLPNLLIDASARAARIEPTILTGGTAFTVTQANAQFTRSALGSAPQLNGSSISNVSDRITSNLIEQNGSVWGAVSDSSGGRNAVRWFRLNADTGALIETGLITSPTLHYFYPSIAVDDAGNVIIGMNGSSSSQYIGSYAVAGKFNGTTTRFGAPSLLAAGLDSHVLLDGSGRNRWGDYSTTVIDPNNPRLFWTFQEVETADRTVPGIGLVDNNYSIRITQMFAPLEGDANVNRSVNFDDLLILAQNYGLATGAIWQQGDFDFDGAVLFSDLLLMAQNYNQSIITLDPTLFDSAFVQDWTLARSLVPESSLVATLGVGAVARRRRTV